MKKINLETKQPDFKARARFIVLTLMLILSYSSILFSATIYIDPTNTSSNQNGSLDNPFDSWTKVTFTNGNTYLQKGGTTYQTSNGLAFGDKSNITLGSYDSDSKAIIEATGKGNHILNITNAQNVNIKDLEITSSGKWISAIAIQGNSVNSLIDNCLLHGTEWGVRILTSSAGTKIMNTTIYNILDDGIYVKNASSIEIGFCKISDINKKYLIDTNQDYSAGDGIQMASTNNLNFYIHDNIIDHSSMGNKFCIIAWGDNYTGVIENNTLIGNNAQVTSGIYLSPTTKTVTVRYNVIKNSNYGIYSFAKTLDAYYNNFSSNRVGISVNPDNSLIARNNVFYNNVEYAVSTASSTNANLKNNIFFMTSGSSKALKTSGTVISDNNVFSQESTKFINEYSSLNDWKNGSGNDKNSVVGNPKFVDATSDDFHLQTNSIAINKGANVELIRDYYGSLVSSEPDAGIHEYGETKNKVSAEKTIAVLSPEVPKEMVVYPNPSIDGKFAVGFGKEYANVELEVFDLTGKLVKNIKVTQSSESIMDLSTQPDGAYLIRLDTGNEMKTLKAIKN